MDINTYETLTGKTVSTAQEDLYEAMIAKTKTMLENLLGYSLSSPVAPSTRYFQYNSSDKYLTFDPFETITSIQLVKDTETIYTFTEDDYRIHVTNGITKSIQPCNLCLLRGCCIDCSQLEVVADWEWDTIPTDLQYLWVDMITFETDPKSNIKSQTLGTHSYTLADTNAPQFKKENQVIIGKYAGGNGSGVLIPTI